MKPFKTIDEQIEILKNRGLLISDEEKAKDFLLCNNYYNVINYYGKPFTIQGTDTYIEGASFDEIKAVYYFDRDLKGTFFKAILEIEKYMKSLIAYYFSESHPQNYSYLDINNYNCHEITDTIKLISGISRIINEKQRDSNPNAIKHYLNRHNHVPLWVIINYFTFGQMVEFFKHMKKQDQNKVAKQISRHLAANLGLRSIKVQPIMVLSYLKNIKEIRNIVAHSNKFLDYNCKTNTLYLEELHHKYNVDPNGPRQDVYNVFIVMQVFLSKSRFSDFSNSIRKKTRNLSKNIHSLECNAITSMLGFPNDWQQSPAIKTTRPTRKEMMRCPLRRKNLPLRRRSCLNPEKYVSRKRKW